jgi:hypothetical protein
MNQALNRLAQALDLCAEAGQELAQAVAGGQVLEISEATENLSLLLLDVQRALPAAAPALEKTDPAVRRQWAEHLASAIRPLQVGTEVSTLAAASAAARLGALASLTGADMSYSNSGHLSR